MKTLAAAPDLVTAYLLAQAGLPWPQSGPQQDIAGEDAPVRCPQPGAPGGLAQVRRH